MFLFQIITSAILFLNLGGSPEPVVVNDQGIIELANQEESTENVNTDKVVIEVFSDFQCPYCARHAATIETLRERDDVEIVFYNYPLSYHSHAKSAALAQICAQEQGKGWEMHDTLFANQSNLADEAYSQYAEDLGLDTDTFETCLTSDEAQQTLDDQLAKAEARGISATPTSFVNDEEVVGAVPIENIEKIIREQENND